MQPSSYARLRLQSIRMRAICSLLWSARYSVWWTTGSLPHGALIRTTNQEVAWVAPSAIRSRIHSRAHWAPPVARAAATLPSFLYAKQTCGYQYRR